MYAFYLRIFGLNERVLPFYAFLLFAAIVIFIIVRLIFKKRVRNIQSSQLYPLEGYNLSSEEFYKLVKEIIEGYNMPGVKFSKVQYKESNILSAKRDYLRVSRKDDIFDICLAPFGDGSFVSYWHGRPDKNFKIMEKFDKLTRFEVDIRTLYLAKVKAGIEKAIDEITANQGVRVQPETLADN